MSNILIFFCSTCYILADREPRRKWDLRSDEGIFLGYSVNRKAYKVFNNCTCNAMESINVVVDDIKADHRHIKHDDDDQVVMPLVSKDVSNIPANTACPEENKSSASDSDDNDSNRKQSLSRIQKYHPTSNIIRS